MEKPVAAVRRRAVVVEAHALAGIPEGLSVEGLLELGSAVASARGPVLVQEWGLLPQHMTQASRIYYRDLPILG